MSMSGAVLDDDTGGVEDWVLLSPREIPAAANSSTRLPLGPTQKDYINFQMRTVFGTLSFVARPIPNDNIAVTEEEGDESIHQQEQSRLFRLPVEIRLEIYEHIFRAPTSGSAAKVVPFSKHDRRRTSLTVLLACRRALAEAESIFYSVNRFSFDRHDELTAFLASLGPRRKAALTKLTVEVGAAARVLLMLQQLHALPNLKSLHVQRQASAKYQDVSGWAVMAPQLITEIRKMQDLAEVKILTPEASSLTEHEIARKKKLDGIDLRIESAALGRAMHAGAAE